MTTNPGAIIPEAYKRSVAVPPKKVVKRKPSSDPFEIEGTDPDAIKKSAVRGLHRARHLGV